MEAKKGSNGTNENKKTARMETKGLKRRQARNARKERQKGRNRQQGSQVRRRRQCEKE